MLSKRILELTKAANHAFLPFYYGDNDWRAMLCVAFRDGAVWQDRQSGEYSQEKALKTANNYSDSQYGYTGDNDWLTGQFREVEKAFIKGARRTFNNKKDDN